MPKTSRRSVNRTKTICGQCELEVKEEKEENIQCDKCAKIFHVLCTKLDKPQYQHLLDCEEEEFICHMCNNGRDDNIVTKELLLINKKLAKLDELQDSMNFMSSKFDEVLKGILENKEKIKNIEKENRQLKLEVNNLKDSVKMLNDQRVKNHCIISGVTTMNDLSAAETVIEISGKVGVEIQAQSIEEAYFLKKKDINKPSQIVVKFNSKTEKEKLMSAKSKFKDAENSKSIYINDFLSKESLELLKFARTLKNVGFHAVYSNGGKIFAKRSAITRPRLIRNEEDVKAILLEATTNQSRRLSRKVISVEDSDEDAQADFTSL